MSTKQLYEKTSEGMKEVSPLVAIEDIYSKLSDTPLEALVSLYNHVKCEWKGSVADTRRTVPLFLRRSGLFITYNNGTKYVTEFFSAGTDQITTEGWIKDSNWTPIPDEDYISAGVKPGFGTIGYEQLNDNLKQLFREKVNVTNFPDDEDIASVDNMLKFKDREANSTNFQSKGYVILRKNLRLVNGVVKNVLTQNMINKPNTIYEIRYDFDLNGAILEICDGCTLKFNGGCFKNGSLVGNNTNIKYVKGNVLFKENLNITGKWNVPYITSSMFEDLSSDNEIKKLISLTDKSIFNTVIIEHGTYNVSVKSPLDYAIGLNSNTKLILNGTISLAPNNFANYDVLKISDSSNVVVEGTGSIIGDKSTHTGTTGEWGVGVEILNSKNIKIDGINILDCWGDCVYVGDNSKQICLSNLNIDNGRRQGISIVSGDNIVVENCIIRNISGTNPEYGIDIEPNKEQSIDNVYINNIKFYSCKGGILSYGGANNAFIGNVKISNCSFDNVYEKNTISLHGVNNASIINCNIIANTCISVQSCNSAIIENCYLDSRKVDGTGTERTIFSTKNNVLSILNNIILSNGVAIRDSSNTLIEHNDITCLSLFDGFPANINNTKIINNTISGYLNGQFTNCTINNNTIKAQSFVKLIESSVINNNKFLYTITIRLLKDSKICYNIFSGTVKTDDTDRNPVTLYCMNAENSIINSNYFNNGNIESTLKNCIISSNILKYDSGECLKCNNDSINVIIDNNIIYYIGTSEQLNMIALIGTTFSTIMNNLLDPNSLMRYAVQFTDNKSINNIVRNNRLISPCKVGGRPFGPINDGCIIESADYATKGDTSKRPIIKSFSESLNDGDTAYPYFDTTLNKIIYWTGYEWVDAQGENPDNNNSGSSENRPTSANIGFMYFDTTLHKPIYYNGNGWVDSTGANV